MYGNMNHANKVNKKKPATCNVTPDCGPSQAVIYNVVGSSAIQVNKSGHWHPEPMQQTSINNTCKRA